MTTAEFWAMYDYTRGDEEAEQLAEDERRWSLYQRLVRNGGL